MIKNTAHVQVHRNPDDHGNWQVLVDGVDITKAIMADGLSIEFLRGEADSEAHVTLTLVADPAVIDLPEAVLRSFPVPAEEVAS